MLGKNLKVIREKKGYSNTKLSTVESLAKALEVETKELLK